MAKFSKFPCRARLIGSTSGRLFDCIGSIVEVIEIGFPWSGEEGYICNVPGYISPWTIEAFNLEGLILRPELGSIEELSNILGGWMPSKNVEVV